MIFLAWHGKTFDTALNNCHVTRVTVQ